MRLVRTRRMQIDQVQTSTLAETDNSAQSAEYVYTFGQIPKKSQDTNRAHDTDNYPLATVLAFCRLTRKPDAGKF